jgi:DNA-binding transcriptional LysR family regulator
MPELSAMEVLVAVAGAGSFNAAAGELRVSQQAVSARIAALEGQTGVTLVARSPRGSSLTPAGLVASEWASRLLSLAGEMDAGLAALRQDARTAIRVAASVTIAEYLLPSWLVALQTGGARRDEAAVTVELLVANTTRVAQHVRDGDVDLGFIEGPAAPRDLRSVTVGHDRLVIAVRVDHPWARHGNAITPPELARTPLVVREEGSGTRDVFTAVLRAAIGRGVEVAAPALVLPTTAAVRAALIAGAGPAVISELAVADDIANGRLTTAPIAGLDLSRRFRAIWRGTARPPAGTARDLVAIASKLSLR